MSLSIKQIKFLETQMIEKTPKEIRDMVGLFYKQNIHKGIRNKKEPQPIKNIIKKILERKL